MGTRLLAPLAALVVAVAGCGSASTAAPTVPAGAVSGPAGSHAPVPTQLQFTASTVDGRPFSGASLLGKPAVLWFWAPWCPVCEREAPTVAKVAAEHPSVAFVGVAAQDQLPAMRQFVDRYQLGAFPQLADSDAAIWARFGVVAQPAFAFVGAAGHIDVVEGPLTQLELTNRIAALAGQ